MRKLIYGISLFIFLFLLSTAYYNSYEVSRLKAQVREMEEKEVPLESLTVESETARHGYYLMNNEGMVYVYQGDKTTLYEQTTISLKDLPAKLQDEISEGKYLQSEMELYSFLENYSS